MSSTCSLNRGGGILTHWVLCTFSHFLHNEPKHILLVTIILVPPLLGPVFELTQKDCGISPKEMQACF